MSAPSGLTRAQVAHVAKLARLALRDDELDRMTVELARVLDLADELSRLDTTGVEPTAHPLPLVNVLRPDTVVAGVERAEVLGVAPHAEADRFRVPRILGEAP